MAGNEDRPSTASSASLKPSTTPSRPTITLPPRASFTESLFNNNGPGSGFGFGFSPGPMTLVSNFFADSDDCKSFSQLLAGAMSSPAAGHLRPNFSEQAERGSGDAGAGDADFQFKQNRPAGLVIAQPPPIFAVPPGLSPATLLESPNFGLFSPAQGAFGMTHQQALAQVTAQAAQAQSHTQIPAEYPSSLSSAPTTSMTQVSSLTANTTTNQQMTPLMPDSSVQMKESSDFSHSDQRPQSSSYVSDKPADDPYNWRKYGQKHVKGSEFPRSYYKCTHPNCPVKKKVERSLDGQVTEIIYKGQHNHPPPQSNKRAKDAGSLNGNLNNQGSSELASQLKEGAGYSMSKKDQESSQVTPENISGTSDSEEVGDAETAVFEKDEDEPDAKRRSTEIRVSEPTASHRTVTEPRIIVQTTSEVDLLDDGYRWRKYGQKVVKGNPYPRSYYKCTTTGCNVRKHVERASTDPKAVITTYEGKHNHDVPAGKNSSHNTANSNASQIKPHNTGTNFGNNNQQPIARLRLKEEHLR
ncbi:putative WRKY transcription factor 4 [Citrus sinensis]|uniref:WRKY transcription factor 4 n=1 Tax=Citrus sinensis TaxID=2711 RepID=A0ACB8LM12_CITSI|nr:putative WRKY transcription factor 4 [Citrus sinensis]